MKIKEIKLTEGLVYEAVSDAGKEAFRRTTTSLPIEDYKDNTGRLRGKASLSILRNDEIVTDGIMERLGYKDKPFDPVQVTYKAVIVIPQY